MADVAVGGGRSDSDSSESAVVFGIAMHGILLDNAIRTGPGSMSIEMRIRMKIIQE
jgi:hypothetical protein